MATWRSRDRRAVQVAPDRGREGFRLPALRTVRAVFPHTALQSVVSSSGVSPGEPGCVECEQPCLREEGVGPALLVLTTATEAGAFLLLAQERAQPSADHFVDADEDVWI